MFNILRKFIGGKPSHPEVHPNHLLSPELMEQLKGIVRHTPDAQQLSMYKWQLMFVYNECQSNQRDASTLGAWNECEQLGEAFTQKHEYVMFKKCLGNETFPIAFNMRPDQMLGSSNSFFGPTGAIKGQLFKMRPYRIFDLDKHVLNNVQFDRVRVTLDFPYRVGDPKTGENFNIRHIQKITAWMYVGRDTFWYPMFDSEGKHNLSLVKRYHSNAEENPPSYYYFHEKFENTVKSNSS